MDKFETKKCNVPTNDNVDNNFVFISLNCSCDEPRAENVTLLETAINDDITLSDSVVFSSETHDSSVKNCENAEDNKNNSSNDEKSSSADKKNFDENIFFEKDGKLYFKSREAYNEWWIKNYEEKTGSKYIWWLPSRRLPTLMDYVPYIDEFMWNTLEIFYYKGIFYGLYSHFIVMWFVCFVIVWGFVIYVAAFLTFDERRLIATIQNRHGPARVGYGGILQPIADAVKMLFKEFIQPRNIRGKVFRHSAILSFVFASFFWTALPYNGEFNVCVSEFTILFLILISLLHAYAVLTAGWSSNSKYSFLGGVRTAAQLISYDIAIILVFVCYYINVKSLNLEIVLKDQHSVGSFFKYSPYIALIFIICFLAETSRHPFDLPEAESEPVSGYNVEYSSIRFAMFFLAEYASVVFVSILFVTAFLNPNYNYDYDFLVGSFKMLVLIFLSIWLRSLIPRYRYDQLMRSCWKTHIPILCANFFFNVLLYLIL